MHNSPSGSDHGESSTLYDDILYRGWLNLKIRSMVNVRPRHIRYCMLHKETQLLSTFKFQPSHGDLSSGLVKPLRAYKVLGVAPWKGRRFAFLLNVVQQQDNVDRVLEIDAPTASAAEEWIQFFHIVTSDNEDIQSQGSSIESPTAPQPSSSRFNTSLTFTQTTKSNSTFSSSNIHDEKTKIQGNLEVTKQPNLWVKGASIHRGLLNNAGENNCFLNVIIQSFWHLISMRQFLLHVEIREESRTVEANVLRALKAVMKEYDDTTSGTIHSRAIRKGLSVLYSADKNFQEGAMYDAEETMLALLNLMHQHSDATQFDETKKTMRTFKSLVRILSDEQYEETPQAVFDEHSIPHLVFSHQIYDRFVCQMCLYKGEWDLYSNLLFTTYATDFYSKRFEDMENMLANMAQSRDVNPSCDLNGCKGKHSKERVIRRFPMVFAISILWATDSATKNQVEGLFNNLKERVDLAKAFVADGPAYKFRYGGARTTYRMRGFVCYYGKHYVAFFYSTAHKMWLLFDDNRVLEIGPWETVVSECLKIRYQPVLIFYEIPDIRKDSSIHLAQIADLRDRLKSSSFNSAYGDLAPAIEGDDEMARSPPAPSPISSKEPASSIVPPAPSVAVIEESHEEEATSPPVPTPIAQEALQEKNQENETSSLSSTEIIKVEVDKEAEEAEIARDDSHQNIVPVSAAIAMCPRTLAMNSPCSEDEYDVMFGEESSVLGMYLEKIENDLCVTSFPRGVHGELFGAEKCGKINLFDSVIQANGHPLQHYVVDRALKMIKAQSRPLIIRFCRSKRVTQLMEMGFTREKATQALVQTNGDVQAAANVCFELSHR